MSVIEKALRQARETSRPSPASAAELPARARNTLDDCVRRTPTTPPTGAGAADPVALRPNLRPDRKAAPGYDWAAVGLVAVAGIITTLMFLRASVQPPGPTSNPAHNKTAETRSDGTNGHRHDARPRRPSAPISGAIIAPPIGAPRESVATVNISNDGSRTPPFRATGVVLGGREAHAVVNEVLVKVGDVIDGARVVMISESAVRLALAGIDIEVPLHATGIESSSERRTHP